MDIQRGLEAIKVPGTYGTGVKLLLAVLEGEDDEPLSSPSTPLAKERKNVWPSPGLEKLRKSAWHHKVAESVVEYLKIETWEEEDLVAESLQLLAFVLFTSKGEKHAGELERKCGAGSLILNTMRSNRDHVYIQSCGLHALRRLAMCKRNQEVYMLEGAPELIVQAMETHRHDANLQKEACETIHVFANGAAVVTFVRVGAVERLLEAMLFHGSDCQVDESASGALTLFSGKLDTVLESMARHFARAVVQEWGCSMIAELAEEGGCEESSVYAIFDAVDNHPKDASVKASAIRALNALGIPDSIRCAMTDSSWSIEWIALALRIFAILADDPTDSFENGDVSFLLNVIKQGTSASVLENTFGLLEILAQDDMARMTLLEMGTVDTVVQAMQQFPSAPKVQYKACQVLMRFATEEEVACDVTQIVTAVQGAMEDNAASADVLYCACLVLGRLASSKDAVDTMIQIGAADAILHAMTSHPDDARLQKGGCEALINFASQPGGSGELCVLGAFDIVQGAMEAHSSDDVFITVALSLSLLLQP